ncbi:DUF6415 family natural product biosynthesis protein [Streptomyces sp. NPDC056161]|uniref:DUF6415 family natural product biosynthesis protein n=1 Tax=Streptomyces sp. NPDC056161 TaxID=3345732 RepID=UPI0035E0DBE0
MTQPTDRPVTRQPLDDLIAEAAAATGILPTIDRCHQLNRELRAALADLASQARTRQAAAGDRSRDWYRYDRLLTDTAGVLGQGLGYGLLSAALHVSALGRQAQALADGLTEQQT